MFSEERANAGVTFPKGFKAAGVKAGIKKSGNLDLAMIYTEKEASIAGVFTQNAVAAAPVVVSRAHVATGSAHAVVANAGCANACTGETGLANANKMAELAAKELGCDASDVLVGSTGIIGVNLPMDKVEAGIKAAAAELSDKGSQNAGNAIITTDTYSKACSCEVMLGGKAVRFGAIAKGSGMIQPNMATMLCYITTDAKIASPLLQKALSSIVEVSFNMISVDGDTSTNDTLLVLANGKAKNEKIKYGTDDYYTFLEALHYVNETLAKKMAGDGEGATALFETKVIHAASKEDARTLAKSVICSSLTKAAIFGHDANWGRILCALGYSGARFDPENVDLYFESKSGKIHIFGNGVACDYSEEEATKILSDTEVTALVDMHMGDAEATAWGCDLSYDYVKINADYRS